MEECISSLPGDSCGSKHTSPIVLKRSSSKSPGSGSPNGSRSCLLLFMIPEDVLTNALCFGECPVGDSLCHVLVMIQPIWAKPWSSDACSPAYFVACACLFRRNDLFMPLDFSVEVKDIPKVSTVCRALGKYKYFWWWLDEQIHVHSSAQRGDTWH